MELPELKTCVMRAIAILYARDSDLFSRDASDWAIAYRLAVYWDAAPSSEGFSATIPLAPIFTMREACGRSRSLKGCYTSQGVRPGGGW